MCSNICINNYKYTDMYIDYKYMLYVIKKFYGSRKIYMLFFLELYYSNVKFLTIILEIY